MNPPRIARQILFILISSIGAALLPQGLPAQSPDNKAVILGIDASVAARDENVIAYTVTEHYSVYRNQDKDQPAAQLIVATTYRKDQGKSYTILSQSGSTLIRNQLFPRILQSEREMTQPANRTQAVITSANYKMQIKGQAKVAGHDCLIVSISPLRNSPYLFTGTLWVDALDESIVQLQGVASKSPSMLAGATQVTRTYDKIDGYPMATHATATSSSWLLGQTTIRIDYTGYKLTLAAPQAYGSK